MSKHKTAMSSCAFLLVLLCGALGLYSLPCNAASSITTTDLYSFGVVSSDGQTPKAGLVLAGDGNFYGTTYSGGSNFDGTVYRITPQGAETVIHNFADGSIANDGISPTAALVNGPSGYLYGTTSGGGSAGVGTVFRVSTSGAVTILHSFGDGSVLNDGGVPLSRLWFYRDGNFYGTTQIGGAAQQGTVFRITPSGVVTILHSFGDGSITYDGSAPTADLVAATDLNFYGTTPFGGSANNGIAFRITPSGSFTKLHDFATDYPSVNDGVGPTSALTQGFNSLLYGVSPKGGTFNAGTVFSMTLSGTVNVLYNFDGAEFSTLGSAPKAALIKGADSNLYGTTSAGGANRQGIVFRISPSGELTTLHTFDTATDASDGATPLGALSQATNGTLYGTASQGGSQGLGSAFSISLVTPRFDFNGDGNSDLLWENSVTGDVETWDMDDTTTLTYGSSFAQVPNLDWRIVATPDINADGHPDLLWWNSSTGQLLVWTMDNTTALSYGKPFAQVKDTTWQPVAAGDFDGEGHWSLIWQNSKTGSILRWRMSGTVVTDYGSVFATVSPSYHVVAFTDFNGDGHSDLLFWNSQNGTVLRWLMDDTTVLSYGRVFAQVTDTNWHLVGAPDMNSDGHPDLLWENYQTGAITRWLMDDTTVVEFGAIFEQVADPSWRIVGMR